MYATILSTIMTSIQLKWCMPASGEPAV